MLPRLKTAEQFAAVLEASKRRLPDSGVWRNKHFVLHMAPYTLMDPARSQPASEAMIGAICPKRWAKRAVTRNTIKRQMYAVTQEWADQLPKACLVFRLAQSFSREEFKSATSARLKQAIRAELQELLQLAFRRTA